MKQYTFDEIDKLKSKLDNYRPLSNDIVKNLHDSLVLNWTYHSNAIEGNTLTINETKVVLEGITVGGKTLREHFEAINHREAILYLENIVLNTEDLSERVIKEIHYLILKDIDNSNAGAYRNINVMISGATHTPPSHMHLNDLMYRLLEDYKSWNNLHPVEQAARIHSEFVKIHPFIDGNGRTSRLLMNLILMKHGYPAAVLPVSKRLDYYNALDKAHVDGDYDDFISLIGDIVKESFNPYWYALGVE